MRGTLSTGGEVTAGSLRAGFRWRRAAFVLTVLSFAAHPEAALAAEGSVIDLPKIINFTIVATIIVLAVRKPLGSYLTARAEAIREQLAEARAAREHAASARDRARKQAATLDDEVETARRRIAEAAVEEGRRIVARAEEQAEKISAAAKAELDKEVRAAERRLSAGAAGAAVRLARARLRTEMTDEDHRRLVASGVAAIQPA